MIINSHLKEILEDFPFDIDDEHIRDILINKSVHIDSTSVSNMLYDNIIESNKKEYRDFLFPNLAPPWKYVWYEYKLPLPIKKAFLMDSVACLSVAINPDEQFYADRIKCLNTKPQDKKLTLKFIELKDITKWAVVYHIYTNHKFCLLYAGSFLTLLNQNGSCIFDTTQIMKKTTTKICFATGYPETKVVNLLSETTVSAVLPILQTVALLHCKNILLEDINTNDLTKLNKKRAKHGKLPMIKFKTLMIESMRETIKKQIKEGIKPPQTDIKLPLHICRGHFKDYRSGGGLFGKHKGLYWWNQTAKGSEKIGVIVKDYKIKLNHIIQKRETVA